MKHIISLSIALILSATNISAQGLFGVLKKAVQSTTSAAVSNATIDFGEVPMPDIDDIEWSTIKPLNKNLPTIQAGEFNASFMVDGYGVKFSDGKQFAYDGKVKSQAAVMATGWKLFKNVKAVSKQPFTLPHANQCWYLLSYELNDKGDIVNREIHWVGWPVK